MRTIKAVIFDLDGTLVDSAPDIQVAINKLLAEEGRRPATLEEVAAMIGDGAPKLVERAMNATGAADAPDDLPTLTGRFLGFYEGHTTDLTRPYPGVREALERLRSAGVRMGICTNKPERPTRELLRDLRLLPYFQAVFGGDTVAGVKKPDPRLIEAVLDALGARPAEAVMVGDAANDVAAARAAGIPVILRAGGYAPVPANELGADRIIIDFLELPEAMLAVSAVDAGARCESAGSTARMPRHAQTAPERLQGSRLDKRARRQ
jgi:phosphoglycolate phosphatase